MLIYKKMTILTLFFAIMTSSIQGQEPELEECYDSAYMESCQSAHWSIYIPIAAYAAAAIFLGIADSKHSEHYAHSRSDALGPAGNSSESFSGFSSTESYGGSYSRLRSYNSH